MNAVQLLIQDHDELRGLFKEFEEAGERAYKKQQTIFEKVQKELKAHEQLEERIFYPAVREKGGKELEKLVLEGIEEHRVADFVVERLANTAAEDETYRAKFMVLRESVEHHIKEEEKEMFPEARKALKEDLDRLGAEMEALEKKLEG